MSWKFAFGCLILIGVGAAQLWMMNNPLEAEDVGGQIDDPQYLLGCYFHGETEIRLEADQAQFGLRKVPISFGMRKALREVLYPDSFPWFDPETGQFEFRTDRFELLDLVENDDGVWELQIWESNYLRSNSAIDLNTVSFLKGECREGN